MGNGGGNLSLAFTLLTVPFYTNKKEEGSLLFFGFLCESPCYPALLLNLNSLSLVGPLPPYQLKQMTHPLSPPQWPTWFGMLYHTLIAQAGLPRHAAMLKWYLWNFAFFPWANPILFELDWDKWVCKYTSVIWGFKKALKVTIVASWLH